MSITEIIRAWKDEDYRLGLDETTLAQMPAHPAGLIELDDADLAAVAGGAYSRDRPSKTNVRLVTLTGPGQVVI